MNSSPLIQIAAFYRFQTVADDKVSEFQNLLEAEGTRRGLRGLMILATEGLNGTVSGLTQAEVEDYLAWVATQLGFPPFELKWSEADFWPFRKFSVRPRVEIVTLGKPEVQPLPPKSQTHLSPDEWDRAIAEGAVVLDTRNSYETRIGKFKGAIDPGLEEFREFSTYLETQGPPKNQKVLIYCTGGIRCEKAIVEMHKQGYSDVYQLDGGILNYLAQKPEQSFEGECFVFDNRVAVDQKLAPSKLYALCPHCGQPADVKIVCSRCDTDAVICPPCSDVEHKGTTCSKNCANHKMVAPHKKGRNQGLTRGNPAQRIVNARKN